MLKRFPLHYAKFLGDWSNFRKDMPFFQYGGFLPFWICDVHVWTTHEEHLVVVVTVQNLVGIDAVVSITSMFFLISRVWLENADSGPKNCGFGDSNETCAPIANPPNSTLLGGSPYHSPKLHPGPCSSVDVLPRTDTHTHTLRQAHRRG